MLKAVATLVHMDWQHDIGFDRPVTSRQVMAFASPALQARLVSLLRRSKKWSYVGIGHALYKIKDREVNGVVLVQYKRSWDYASLWTLKRSTL